MAYIDCIYKINCQIPVVSQDVYDALRYFQITDFSCLNNKAWIKQKFFEEIGRKYEEYFTEYGDTIYTKIRVECGPVVYEWANRYSRMMSVIECCVKKICEQQKKGKAVEQVRISDADMLRNKIINF